MNDESLGTECSKSQCPVLLLHFCGRIEENTMQYSTVQYNTVQYSTVQYSTIQYSTIQYNVWGGTLSWTAIFFFSWPSCISMLANALWQLPGASVDSALVTLCHFIVILFIANNTSVRNNKITLWSVNMVGHVYFVNSAAWTVCLSGTEWVLNLKSWNSYAVLKLCEVAALNFKFLWCKISKCGPLVASLSVKVHGPCDIYSDSDVPINSWNVGYSSLCMHVIVHTSSHIPGMRFLLKQTEDCEFSGFYSGEMKDVTLCHSVSGSRYSFNMFSSTHIVP
jgi:hypothetical protein